MNDFSADDLSIRMSQVNLEDEEIKELKAENEKIKSELAKMNESKNKILQDRSQLQKKFNELKERNIGKGPLQGVKHIIWDTLSVEVTKFRHYLNFVDDQCILINLANQRLKLVNETMDRNPLTIAQNALNFLNSLTYQKLHDMGIKDRISIVLWAKNFIHKHHLMKTVQDKADEMVSQVNNFKQVFKELFEDGLPSFWDKEGWMFS